MLNVRVEHEADWIAWRGVALSVITAALAVSVISNFRISLGIQADGLMPLAQITLDPSVRIRNISAGVWLQSSTTTTGVNDMETRCTGMTFVVWRGCHQRDNCVHLPNHSVPIIDFL
jgi:hypothetical protein